jgi:hypothetical protein
LNIKNRFVFLARNCPEVKLMKDRYASERNTEMSERVKKNQREGGSNIVTFDALFQSLPYYMKRCVLLETILENHELPVPPEGVCDNWGTGGEEVAEGEGLPAMPENDETEKR